MRAVSTLCFLLLVLGCGPRAPEPGPSPDPAGSFPKATERVPDPAEFDRIDRAAGSLRALPPGAPGPAEAPGASLDDDPLVGAVRPLCFAGDGPCKQAMERVREANLPVNRLWPLLSSFRGEGRGRATIVMGTMAPRLIDHEDPTVRDRFLRILVGAGVLRRPDSDDEGDRGYSFPPKPKPGEPVWILVEAPAPCPVLKGDHKGPDSQGRIDVAFRLGCEAPKAQPGQAPLAPPSGRAIWTLALPAFPGDGLTIWRAGGAEVLLAIPASAGP